MPFVSVTVVNMTCVTGTVTLQVQLYNNNNKTCEWDLCGNNVTVVAVL